MSLILSVTTISVAFVLSAALNPLSLGIWLLLLAFIVATIISATLSSWWGLVTFLIYVGGLLVMFAYFSAVTPNQHWELAPLFFFSFALILVLILNSDLLLSPDTLTSLELTPPSITPLFTLLLYQNALLYLSLALILFLALIIVVSIASLASGPLRPFN